MCLIITTTFMCEQVVILILARFLLICGRLTHAFEINRVLIFSAWILQRKLTKSEVNQALPAISSFSSLSTWLTCISIEYRLIAKLVVE